MKAPIKAKAAAEMLFEVIYSLTPTIYCEWKVDDIIRLQVRARAIVYYRLCPITIINVSESDTLKELMKKMIENKLWTGDDFFVEVFNVLKNYPIIGVDDLQDEFIELCPNVDSFEKYFDIFIKPLFSSINYQDVDKSCVEYLAKRSDSIFIDVVTEITNNIYTIQDLVGQVFRRICMSYNHFLYQNGDKQIKQREKKRPFPNELNSDKAKNILQKAMEAGLCDDAYKWFKSKALLAYFADKASEYLGLCKGEYDGKPKTSWKPFETLFGISGLSGAKRDYQKIGVLPDGCKDVDNLF